jgi:hypothetical protein
MSTKNVPETSHAAALFVRIQGSCGGSTLDMLIGPGSNSNPSKAKCRLRLNRMEARENPVDGEVAL